MPLDKKLSPAAIALNRFGLGTRLGDAVPDDPRRWLTDQFASYEVRPAGFAALADATQTLQRYDEERRARKERQRQETSGKAALAPAAGQQADAADGDRRLTQMLYRHAVQARTDAALSTEAPFVERLVHFWANHFCVSADNQRIAAFAGEFERDAIRPHVLGRFEDMLLAVEQHPAMLLYLNQANSIGPNSPAAQRGLKAAAKRKRGLNENLAREIMELHTLGVRSGYTQADVTEFARALTGWTTDYRRNGTAPGDGKHFVFRPDQHEPGTRAILDRTYDQPGQEQARAVLADFARAPATATHVATKLARHFAGDTPPPALVTKLRDEFLRTGGDLPSLYHVLVRSDEAWMSTAVGFQASVAE